MKLTPRYNFPINIQHYIWEVDEGRRYLYDGIYEVILNFHINVMFVPEIHRSIARLISSTSTSDDINDQMDARLFVATHSAYSVTPNELLAGQEEVLPAIHLNSGQEDLVSSLHSDLFEPIVFYVSQSKFENFHNEIALLNQEVGRASNSKNIFELKEFEFAEFIINRVITSKYFHKFDLAILGR